MCESIKTQKNFVPFNHLSFQPFAISTIRLFDLFAHFQAFVNYLQNIFLVIFESTKTHQKKLGRS